MSSENLSWITRVRSAPPPLPTEESEPLLIPPPPSLPRFPANAIEQNVLGRTPDSLAPAASSIAPSSISRPPSASTADRAHRVAPFFAISVIGAIAATVAGVAFLWSPVRDYYVAPRSLAAVVAPTTMSTVGRIHYLRPVNITADAPPIRVGELSTTTPAANTFDSRHAWVLVSSGAQRAYQCGLRGVDALIEVTFAPSGTVTLVNVVGDGPLPDAATSCADKALFGLKVPAFEGESEVVRLHLDGRTSAVRH